MNDPTLIIIGVVFFVLPFLIVIPVVRMQNRKYESLFDTQKTKRNGKITKTLGIVSQLEYPLQGQSVKVRISRGGKNSPPTTSMTMPLNTMQKFTIYVGPEFVLSRWAKKLGMQDIQVMNPTFDDAFLVRSNNEAIIRQILDHETQKAFLTLKDLSPSLTNYNHKLIVCLSPVIH